MKNTFSISQAFSFGWTTFKSRWKFWLIVFILVFGSSGSSTGGSSSSSNRTLNKTGERVESLVAGNKTAPNPNVLGVEFNNTTTSLDYGMENTSIMGDGTPKHPYNSLKALAPLLIIAVPYFLVVLALAVFYIVLSIGVSLVMQMGFTHLSIDAARGNSLEYKTLLSDVSVKKGLRLFWLAIVQVVLVFLGLLLFIVPGIYLAVRFMFASQLFVDKNLSVTEALSQSGKLTKGVKLKLIGFMIVSILVALVGLLAFLFGIIPAVMVIQLALAYIYVTLEKQTFSSTAEVEGAESNLAQTPAVTA